MKHFPAWGNCLGPAVRVSAPFGGMPEVVNSRYIYGRRRLEGPTYVGWLASMEA